MTCVLGKSSRENFLFKFFKPHFDYKVSKNNPEMLMLQRINTMFNKKNREKLKSTCLILSECLNFEANRIMNNFLIFTLMLTK